MNTITELQLHKLKLNKLATQLGYTFSCIPAKHGKVNHTTRVIESQRNDTMEEIFDISHEIGHCFQYNRRLLFYRDINKKYKTISKYKMLTITEELEAWIIGFIILKKQQIPVKGFTKHSWGRWKSYLK